MRLVSDAGFDPVNVGPHMTNTDSTPFMDEVAAISVRENERGVHVGSGWDPQWHQPTDLYASFDDADFRLGLNAAQTTLGAVARLAGAQLSPQPPREPQSPQPARAPRPPMADPLEPTGDRR